MRNKQDEFMIKILALSMDGIRKKCCDYSIVVDRDNNTQKDISYNGDDPFVLASLIYKSLNMTGLRVNKIYYHKMTGLDVMVVGILTGHRRPNQNIVLEAV